MLVMSAPWHRDREVMAAGTIFTLLYADSSLAPAGRLDGAVPAWSNETQENYGKRCTQGILIDFE